MSQIKINQPEPVNHFPDCLFMKLHIVPIQPTELSSIIQTSTNLQKAKVDAIDLKLTLRFGEYEIKVLGGTVRFGLKGGKLKLKLVNCRIPIEKMGLTAEFENKIDIEVQQENGKEAEINAATASSIKAKKTNKIASKAKYKLWQCHAIGTETNPIWIFEAKTVEQILKGQLTEEQLGTVEIVTKPCVIKANFEVKNQRDLYLIESQGWFKAENLSRNASALLTREMYLRIIEPKLQPFLSQFEIQL